VLCRLPFVVVRDAHAGAA